MPSAPYQMQAHTLDCVKGAWPGEHALEYRARISEAAKALIDPIPPGRVGYLNSDGEFALGLGTAAVMPLFIWPRSNDPDVENYGGDPASEKFTFVSVMPHPDGNEALFLVGSGAYELASTEFDSGQSYARNTFLTSGTSTSAAGTLTPGTRGTHMCCGMVSRGIVDNGWKRDAICFWAFPVFPNV